MPPPNVFGADLLLHRGDGVVNGKEAPCDVTAVKVQASIYLGRRHAQRAHGERDRTQRPGTGRRSGGAASLGHDEAAVACALVSYYCSSPAEIL